MPYLMPELVNQVSKIFTAILIIMSTYICHHKFLDATKHKILLVNFLNNGSAWMENWLTLIIYNFVFLCYRG